MSAQERKKRTHFSQPATLEYGKVPPNAVDLEDMILGAMMLDSTCLNDLIDILREDSFYKLEHQLIYAAIIKLFSASKPVDIATVSAQCKQDGTLEKCGGAYYISKLTDRVASSANAEFHARVIEEKAIKRELIRVSGEVYGEAYEDTTDPLELLDTATRGIEDISGRLAHSNCGTTKDQLEDVKKRARLAAIQKGITGRQTGIKELDLLHGGRQDGHFTIIAARPAMGKTAAALCEVLNMAHNGDKVLFVSLEMSAVQLMQRALSVETGIDLKKFQTGDLDPEQWQRIDEASIRIENSGLRIVDDLHTVNAIRAHARRMKDRGGIDAVYIDYLQLIRGNLGGNREQEISGISRGLKLMSHAMNIPVVALSQLSRAVETRGGSKKPNLSDLRESGSLEQDADIVEFLYRPEYYDVTEVEGYSTTNGLAFRLVAKNRHGGLKDIPMRFHHVITKFTDWSDDHIEPTMVNYIPSLLKPNTNFDDSAPF